MPVLTPDPAAPGAVRVRAVGRDLYAGLRGHHYIAGRYLDRPVRRIARDRDATEQAVINIANAEARRRAATTAPVRVVLTHAQLAARLDAARQIVRDALLRDTEHAELVTRNLLLRISKP